jgi:uncharacterized protein YeeX (DUF496 family)
VASQEEIREENRKVRRLQIVVDLVMNLLWQTDMPVEEAAAIVAQTRQYALNQFPDKELTYDLIYQSRFKRLLAEKYRVI